jgi:hypothetical protein
VVEALVEDPAAFRLFDRHFPKGRLRCLPDGGPLASRARRRLEFSPFQGAKSTPVIKEKQLRRHAMSQAPGRLGQAAGAVNRTAVGVAEFRFTILFLAY